jgi:crotonobetainyl-CoA:carnitine CoA-transferase CaiB-like acyl-CoA transferase
MCEALGVEGHEDPRVATIGERRKHPEVTADIMRKCHQASGNFTCAEIEKRMEEGKVPFALVVSPAELPNDRHAQAIGLFEEFDHPRGGRVRQPRHPARFAGTPAELQTVSPGLGEHTDEVLAEFGFGDRIEQWRAAGIIA